jgi:spore germination protein KB
MQRTHLTSKLFMPVLFLSLLTFGFSFDRYVVNQSIGVNTYLIIFIGLCITIISLKLIQSLAVKYPDQSIIHLGNKLLGPFGKIGTPVWLIVVFLLTALLTRRVTDEVSTIILFRTPGLVSTLAFLLLAGYMALLGDEALGRLSSVLLITVPLFLILLILSFRQVSFLNIHPVNIYRDLGYLKQWDLWLIVFAPVWILGSFNGSESLRNNFKTVILTITGTAIILGATSLAIAGAFGAKGISRFEWPVMSLMNITEFAPSYFFQNFATTVYIFIFLAFSLVTVAGFLIVLSKGTLEFFSLKDKQLKLIPCLMTTALFGVLIFFTQINYKKIVNLALILGSFYTFGYILLIWFSSLLRRKEQR